MSPSNLGRSIEPSVPHYYGDVVRILMLCGVGLALISVPFSAGFMHDFFAVVVVGALIIVAFAALTNPLKSWVALADAIVSAIAVALFEIDAFGNYQTGELVTFVLYEGISILFIVSFYYSLKTLRAFALHQVGKPDSINDFGGNSSKGGTRNPLAEEQKYQPKFMGD